MVNARALGVAVYAPGVFCYPEDDFCNEYPMRADEMKKIADEKNAKYIFLDVREEDEIRNEPYFDTPKENYITLSLSVLSALPMEELATRVNDVIAKLGWKPEETNIITLCHSGRRSEMACQRLSALGFHTENLEGGYLEWKDIITHHI